MKIKRTYNFEFGKFFAKKEKQEKIKNNQRFYAENLIPYKRPILQAYLNLRVVLNNFR